MTGLPDSLRRSTTAAAFVVAMVGSLLSASPALGATGLSSGTVSPASGQFTTPFTFSVHYTHPQQDADSVTALLDGGHPIDLSLMPGDTLLNGTWTATVLVPAGTWTVTFVAESTNGADWGPLTASPSTINVVGPPTPTPVPTPVPTARPTPRPTPRPTARPTPRPTAAPTLRPGATPRPPVVTPPPGATPGTPGTPGSSAAPAASGSQLPSATEGTLAGNPTPSSTEGGGNVPASGSADPNAQETSDVEPSAGVGRVVMLAVGGTLAVSGAGYLAVLAARRRGRVGGGSV